MLASEQEVLAGKLASNISCSLASNAYIVLGLFDDENGNSSQELVQSLQSLRAHEAGVRTSRLDPGLRRELPAQKAARKSPSEICDNNLYRMLWQYP